jgi:parallel beta-helix repeat protein
MVILMADAPNNQPPTQGSAAPSSSPQPPQQSGPSGVTTSDIPSGFRIKGGSPLSGNALKFALIGIVVLVIIAGAVLLVTGKKSGTTITITTPTTIPSNTGKGNTVTTTITNTYSKQLTSCGSISAPGNYTLLSGVSYGNQSGSCIYIDAENVSLDCFGNHISGAGPYDLNPPYTYGILVKDSRNVVVKDCAISNFSYGAYALNSYNTGFFNNSISFDIISNIYLNRSQNSSIYNNQLTESGSVSGSVYLGTGSNSTTLYNNTILFNAFYGINVQSSSNKFYQNYIRDTPTSFTCGISSSFPHSSYAFGNLCYNNTGCSFLSCGGFNTPPLISQLPISSGSVTGCGTISSSGSYSLSGNLDMDNFLNTSNPLVKSLLETCITINSGNVTLDCHGFNITNAPVGISSTGFYNVTIENCRISNSVSGIELNEVSGSNVQNTTVTNSTTGINVSSSGPLDTFANVVLTNNRYGIYLHSTNTSTISGFETRYNSYGIYLNNSFGNLMESGTAQNNTIADIFASSDAIATGENLVQKVTCGVTDALWATSCKYRISPQLSYYPVSSCEAINAPGNYSMQGNLLIRGLNCFQIKSSNVILNCADHSVQLLSGTSAGYMALVSGESNVVIKNCASFGFGQGVGAFNSTDVKVLNSTFYGTAAGITFSKVNGGSVSNDTINSSTSYGISLNNTSNLSVSWNKLTGKAGNSGIAVYNSTLNKIYSNVEEFGYLGFSFEGRSNLNNVTNNSAQQNTFDDYYCDAQNSGVYSERGGINFGVAKQGCNWMLSLNPTSRQISCVFISSPSTELLSTDYIYSYGQTCYYTTANSSTINCQGHTVLATDGGTFAYFNGSTGSIVENCNLRGFTTPIISYKSQVELLNNTIYNYSAINSSAVNLTWTRNFEIQRNNISSYSTGVTLSNDLYGNVKDNNVNSTLVGYYLYNVTGTTIYGDTTSSLSKIGMELIDSTINYLQNNDLLGTKGLLCFGTSNGSQSNTDKGGNQCSTTSGCAWIPTGSSC